MFCKFSTNFGCVEGSIYAIVDFQFVIDVKNQDFSIAIATLIKADALKSWYVLFPPIEYQNGVERYMYKWKWDRFTLKFRNEKKKRKEKKNCAYHSKISSITLTCSLGTSIWSGFLINGCGKVVIVNSIYLYFVFFFFVCLHFVPRNAKYKRDE